MPDISPNGPVGLVWIDISTPHYGIHGTPEPGTVGHTSSHGCVHFAIFQMTDQKQWWQGTPLDPYKVLR